MVMLVLLLIADTTQLLTVAKELEAPMAMVSPTSRSWVNAVRVPVTVVNTVPPTAVVAALNTLPRVRNELVAFPAYLTLPVRV